MKTLHVASVGSERFKAGSSSDVSSSKLAMSISVVS